MKVLVTGCAGFIGFHVARALIERGDEVVGLDSVNGCYRRQLKEDRLTVLRQMAVKPEAGFTFIHANLADQQAVRSCFAGQRFDRVIHRAAQAGVRYAAENPLAYAESNITGFVNIWKAAAMPACRT